MTGRLIVTRRYMLSLVTVLLSEITNTILNMESQSSSLRDRLVKNVCFRIFWKIKHDYYFTWTDSLLNSIGMMVAEY
jgi:hypothetical protein